jgi:hypothetical protein
MKGGSKEWRIRCLNGKIDDKDKLEDMKKNIVKLAHIA